MGVVIVVIIKGITMEGETPYNQGKLPFSGRAFGWLSGTITAENKGISMWTKNRKVLQSL